MLCIFIQLCEVIQRAFDDWQDLSVGQGEWRIWAVAFILQQAQMFTMLVCSSNRDDNSGMHGRSCSVSGAMSISSAISVVLHKWGTTRSQFGSPIYLFLGCKLWKILRALATTLWNVGCVEISVRLKCDSNGALACHFNAPLPRQSLCLPANLYTIEPDGVFWLCYHAILGTWSGEALAIRSLFCE